MNMTREERETTRLGPERIRVGFRAKGAARRTFYEVQNGRIRAGEVNIPGISDPGHFFIYTRQESGVLEYVLGADISDVVVIRDWQNYYEEHIDSETMTLTEYLETV